MKKCLIYLIFIFFCSCSTNWNKVFDKKEDTAKRNENLMKDFQVNKEVLEKFKTKKIIEKPRETKVVKKRTVKKVQPLRKRKDKKTKINLKNYPQELVNINNKVKETFENFSSKLVIGEKVFMDINYMGVSTGKIVLTTNPMTEINGHEAYHFNAKLQTSRYYSYLYELDDQIDSYVKKETFVPLKFSLIQRESGQSVDDLQLFDLEKLEGFKFYKRVSKKKVKKNQGKFVLTKYFQDPLSLVYFIKGLDFENKKSYIIPFYNKGELKSFKVSLDKIEKIDTEIGEKMAYKIKASSNYTGKTIKSGDMIFWFSKDEKRIFLKFKAKIKIGSISGDIEKYEKK